MSNGEPRRQPDQLEGVLPPEQAPELVGHAATYAAIGAQVRTGRLPGALLLHGPQGIGKATLAFALARDILTETGDEAPPRVAEQVAGGVHPNVFILRRRPRDSSGFYTEIRVQDVRDVQARMRQTRGRAGYRVCIVDSIDDCNRSSANALLKILEEPPEETVFLLVSHRPGALLPTIRSRCHSHALRGLSDDAVRAVVTAQYPDCAPDALARAVELAGGRPQRAFEALLLEGLESLDTLKSWLAEPTAAPVGTHLQLAESIAKAGGAEAAFARDMILAWLADEARTAAAHGERNRLASATQLWEKALAQFADADAYNLDARQTLVSIFDALRRHAHKHAAQAFAGSS